MKNRPLVLDDRSLDEIKRVMDFAEANRIDIHRLFRMLKNEEMSVGDIAGYACVIPFGYVCVYSIEQQAEYWTRHLSVSVTEAGCSPNEMAVLELALAFGFKAAAGKAAPPPAHININPKFVELAMSPDTEMWLEDIGPKQVAINLIQKL